MNEIIRKRKSIRKFDLTPLDSDTLEKVQRLCNKGVAQINALTPLYPGIKTKVEVENKTKWSVTGIKAPHLKLEPCRICGNGWGSCRDKSKCAIDDAFAEIQSKLREAEALVLVTPVYFGQPSERMKYFLDRFRRCEAFNKDGSAVAGKQIDMIAAAGGSGNGTAS